MKMTEFDPYEHLMEITRFCNTADTHIQSLISNQKEMTKAINVLKEDISIMKKQVDLLEEIIEGND